MAKPWDRERFRVVWLIRCPAASIRNVMADLEGLGLLYSEHVSAGRLPTNLGLRLFCRWVDGGREPY